ncbi:TetR/AcrR family transcriptional regulator [Pseudoduganella sp. RAF53_2]|uniref:TetR/AcrR family transcriptional regulator n=1 Tax=unclassified Pseudoduganella TaxID=2637179 RepID=UPI003F98DB8F
MNATTDVRQHILDTAQPLFLSRGFTAVGLTEVLGAAGVPKGSFYHYFGSKEAFGEAVIEDYFTGYLARLDEMFAKPGKGARRVMDFFDDWLKSQTGDEASSRCLAVKLGAEVCDLSESMRDALHRGTSGVVDRLAAAIERAREDKSLPKGADAHALAQMLYQSWIGASLLAKIARDRTPLDTALATTRQLLKLA